MQDCEEAKRSLAHQELRCLQLAEEARRSRCVELWAGFVSEISIVFMIGASDSDAVNLLAPRHVDVQNLQPIFSLL